MNAKDARRLTRSKRTNSKENTNLYYRLVKTYIHASVDQGEFYAYAPEHSNNNAVQNKVIKKLELEGYTVRKSGTHLLIIWR